MMDSNRYDRFPARLRNHAEKFPAPLRRLGDALWNPDDAQISHQECLDALAEFIDAELAGESVAKLYPAVKHHLDRCDECGQEYAELLESAWAEQRGALAKPQSAPRPDLSFLPRPNLSLTDVVSQLAKQLLEVINPGRARELAVITAPFFEQVRAFGDEFYLRSGPAPAMNFGRGETGDALKTLAGTYAATQSIVHQVTRRQFQEWQAQAVLATQIEPRARAAAQAIGLDDKFAARLAREYTARVADDPAPLLALLAQE